MQISSSAIILVKNTNKASASMMKDWLGAVPKFNKLTVGLIYCPRDWQWQTLGNNEIIGCHYKILRSE